MTTKVEEQIGKVVYMVEKLTPRNGSGKLDWLGYIRTTWPILVAIVMVVFWFGGRMETPEQKQARIQTALAPVWEELHQKADRDNVPPREVLDRLGRIETDVRELRAMFSEYMQDHGG